MISHTQGIVYSETAAANYPDPDMFNSYLHIIPARRLGYPEEVTSHNCFDISTTSAVSYYAGVWCCMFLTLACCSLYHRLHYTSGWRSGNLPLSMDHPG